MRFGTALGRTGHDRVTWLGMLALVLGVLAPAVCVIWLMNEAMSNQADAARQRVSEAYRGQLRLLRDRIDTDWRARSAALSAGNGNGAAAFRRVVVDGGADSIVFLTDGAPMYPSLAVARGPDTLAGNAAWRAAQLAEAAGLREAAASAYAQMASQETNPSHRARAAQAYVRTLVQAGDTAAAVRAITTYFAAGSLASGRDRQGRLIGADAWLFALRLVSPSDPRRASIGNRLVSLLNDYDQIAMPSTQRLFLMQEVSELVPSASMPTLSAERLAAEFLQTDASPASGPALQPTAITGVWKLGVRDSAVALFKAETVVDAARRVLDEQSAATGVRFALVPPGTSGGDESVSASSLLPGWQVSLWLLDRGHLEASSRERTQRYLWAGTLAIAVLAVAGLLLWQSFRRQLRISRLKTDLVAAVSHELKTPLASVRLLVDSLLDDEELDGRKTRDYLRLIAGENARLSRLIEHFLTFSRIERNRQPIVRTTVQPAVIVHSAVSVIRERFEASGADLTVEVEPDLPPVVGDEDALITVLLNLLENAHTYTGLDKRIAVHAYQAQGRVVFEVRDNGIGIARRDHKRVFRRFYQVDGSLSREHGGCGLGLSIVDFIVRAHGGAVTLRSELGAGSTFCVSVPSRASRQGAAA
jgi:signal transduction histidine kinase